MSRFPEVGITDDGKLKGRLPKFSRDYLARGLGPGSTDQGLSQPNIGCGALSTILTWNYEFSNLFRKAFLRRRFFNSLGRFEEVLL